MSDSLRMGMEVSTGLLLNPPNLLLILGQFLVRCEAFRILNLALQFPCFSHACSPGLLTWVSW